VPEGRSSIPLARALASISAPVVLADEWRDVQGGPARGEVLEPVLDDQAVASQIATLDHLDVVDGPLAAVLVLGERGQGVVGHYGFGKGAQRALPAWWIV